MQGALPACKHATLGARHRAPPLLTLAACMHGRLDRGGLRVPQNPCRVGQLLAKDEGVPCFQSRMVLEGGSVHTDGEGCVMETQPRLGLHCAVPQRQLRMQ